MQATLKATVPDLEATQELKRTGIKSSLSLIGFSLRNWFVSWTFFLPNFVLTLVGMLSSATVFYLMGSIVTRGAEPYISQYGVNYGTYIITGVMFNLVMLETLDAYHNSFLRAYWTGQFDIYMQHPGGVSALLAGEVLAKYLMAMANMVAYFMMGILFFGISIKVANLFDTFAIMVLAIVSLTGLGLAGASMFSLLNAKREETNPIKLLVDFNVSLLAGVYFPPSLLPSWMQKIGYYVPQTHVLNAARLCLTGKATLTDPAIRGDLVYLLVFTAITLPVGIWLFSAGLRKAERDGSLTRWT